MASIDAIIAELGILQWNDPQLSQPSRPVVFPDDLTRVQSVCERLERTVFCLKEAYPSSYGTGLAAPQIGSFLRIVCALLPDDEKTLFFINPRIIEKSKEHTLDYEDCFSFFRVCGRVWRPDRITIEYQDLSEA